jgi:hypothetical protein
MESQVHGLVGHSRKYATERRDVVRSLGKPLESFGRRRPRSNLQHLPADKESNILLGAAAIGRLLPNELGG